jgi:Protein of unknown function (DUF2817)
MSARSYFSADYAASRARFCAAAQSAGARLETHSHPSARAPDGAQLSTDVARFGDPGAQKILIVSSGTHGAEGFSGSGCQAGYLAENLVGSLPSRTALLLVHAINPYGFAHLRRVNEDNVDCNRNFIDHTRRPPNDAYDEVHPLLVPDDWNGPAREAADRAIEAYIEQRGLKAFQAAATGGQYTHPDGLFFGGAAPVWSNQTFRKILRQHASNCSDIGFIDIHTGLGPYGHGELIFVGSDSSEEYRRAAAWYGPDVTATESGTSTSAPVRGVLAEAVHESAPKARVTAIALEYGTLPLEEVLQAIRADNWLHMRGTVDSPLGRSIKQQARAAFYCDEDRWKEMVWDRGAEVLRLAIDGLGCS